MEDEIDIEVNLGKELADKLNKMSKKELLNRLCVMILRNRVQDETIANLEGIEQNLAKQLEEAVVLRKRLVSELEIKLDKAENYIEQGRAMIESIMEKWDHYDS